MDCLLVSLSPAYSLSLSHPHSRRQEETEISAPPSPAARHRRPHLITTPRRREMDLLSQVVGTNSTEQEEEHVQKHFQNKRREMGLLSHEEEHVQKQFQNKFFLWSKKISLLLMRLSFRMFFQWNFSENYPFPLCLEASVIISGLGFSGWTDSYPPKPHWDRAKNLDILGVELAKSAVVIPVVWNIQVSTWLRHCVVYSTKDMITIGIGLAISSTLMRS